MRIGELASATGTSAPTIRYYESIDLLPAAARREGKQRAYGAGDVERLAFIRRCRALGFTLKEIKTFARIGSATSSSSNACRDIVMARLARVRAQMESLRSVETRLVHLVRTRQEEPQDSPCSHLAALA